MRRVRARPVGTLLRVGTRAGPVVLDVLVRSGPRALVALLPSLVASCDAEMGGRSRCGRGVARWALHLRAMRLAASLAVLLGCAASAVADDGSGSGSWEGLQEEEANPEPVDCAGRWSTCDVSCKKAYVISREAAGTGSGCPAPAPCGPGEDLCPQPATPQSPARAFGVTMRTPVLHGCNDACQHCVDHVGSSVTASGRSAVCVDEFITELARTMQVSEKRLSVLSVLPGSQPDTLLFLCQLTSRSPADNSVAREASTLESLRSLEHMVETPEISVYLLGRLALEVQVMDGTSLPPPAPVPPPPPTPDTRGHGVDSPPSGAGAAGEEVSFQGELDAEHARLQEAIVVIFAVLCGIALLLFALAELPEKDKYVPVDELGDELGDEQSLHLGSPGVRSPKNVAADEDSSDAREMEPFYARGAAAAVPFHSPPSPSAVAERSGRASQDGLLDASFDTASVSDMVSESGSMESAMTSLRTPDRN